MPEHYQQDVNSVLRALKTSANGLSNEEAALRLNEDGSNTIQLDKKINVWGLLIGQFTELLVVVLIGAGILSYLVGDPLDTVVIFAIVIINGLLGFFQEYKAERAIDELKKMGAQGATVKRNGKLIQISAKDLVPGDIVQLEEGDKIPADIRFIDVIETSVDEAVLTGESSAVNKKVEALSGTLAVADRVNYGYANTSIVRGRGMGVVIFTGLKTEFGKIAEKLEEVVDEPTPLKQNLEVLAKQLTIGVVIVMVILFIIGYFIQGRELVEMLLLAIALGVAAIPEGLPAVTTITLALGIQQMAQRNALIKHLPSVETLGSTDVICSDKTGTLTKNEMTVEYVYADEQLVHVTGVGYASAGEIQWNNQPFNVERESALEMTIQNGVHNNNSQYHVDEGTILGDPTEGCMLVLGHKARVNATLVRIKEIPFTSERKKMTTVNTLNTNAYRIFMKGAVEKILEKSILVLEHGKRVPMTEGKRQQILQQTETLSKNAYRVLGFAYRDVNALSDDMEHSLVFTGLMALRDPPREEVTQAIQKCLDAGIQVKMITGDHPVTAAAIAEKIGIKGNAITGVELNQMDDAQFNDAVRTHNVFARVDPEHKYKIVSFLQKQGHVVAVTGDGVNDAPAIKKADIGIAMGIKGTDVAKEASDMVLRDDNFASIVNAVELGRTVYQNIQAFVRYLLGANLVEVLVVSLGFFFALGEVITPIQLLWINLATDALPALALGEDPPGKHVMQQKPRSKFAGVLDGMGSFIGIAGILGTAATLGMYMYGLSTDEDYARTLAFTTLVVFELMLVFNARQIGKSWLQYSPFNNIWLIAAVLASFALQMIAVYVPFLHPIFKTESIALNDMLIILGVCLSTTLVPYLAESYNRLTKKKSEKEYFENAWPAPNVN
mgnify:CR=1 FL=1